MRKPSPTVVVARRPTNVRAASMPETNRWSSCSRWSPQANANCVRGSTAT
ncbi:MAG: hypothetical protein JO164_02845 [Candidatus Eremiobacteraeota bacterium]|nr:hypothetical protein [Candidatus Eremiobacteraeota bacterium]